MNEAPLRTRSRYGFAVLFFLSLLVGCLVLRLSLLIRFGHETHITLGPAVHAIAIGLHQDFFVVLITTAPLLFCLWIIRDRWFAKFWFRILFISAFFLFWAVQIFLFFTE